MACESDCRLFDVEVSSLSFPMTEMIAESPTALANGGFATRNGEHVLRCFKTLPDAIEPKLAVGVDQHLDDITFRRRVRDHWTQGARM